MKNEFLEKGWPKVTEGGEFESEVRFQLANYPN